MRRLASLACFVLLAVTATGCGHRRTVVFASGVFVGTTVASHHDHEIIVYEPAPVLISRRYERVPPPNEPAFDYAAARSALAAANLGACRAAGTPRGYGHASVTFSPSGNVIRIVVDAPGGLSPDAVACIGRELGTATVPPFAGRDVTVGTGWVIR